MRNDHRMALQEAKYYIRPILWIIGYILLCIAGGFFIYLIIVTNPPSSTEYPFGHVVVWAVGLTAVAIGLIGLLLIFKLMDYTSTGDTITENQESSSAES
jgi:hypothetical protein